MGSAREARVSRRVRAARGTCLSSVDLLALITSRAAAGGPARRWKLLPYAEMRCEDTEGMASSHPFSAPRGTGAEARFSAAGNPLGS
jgi:hypothetical protein